MEQTYINGSPATHEFRNVAGAVVARGRPGREGGYIVETTEGMRRKFQALGNARDWLGAHTTTRIELDEPKDPAPSKSKK